VIVLFPDEFAPRWIDCGFVQFVSMFPDPTAQVYDTDWAPPVAVSVTVQSDGTVGGVTTLLAGGVGSPCALKVIVGVCTGAWAVKAVVEELPPAAVGAMPMHATLTVKVVPGGTAPVTTLVTVRVGSPTCAPLSVLPTRGTPATRATATNRAQPRDRLKTRFARTVPPASLRVSGPHRSDREANPNPRLR
jgi:hypothetical protein